MPPGQTAIVFAGMKAICDKLVTDLQKTKLGLWCRTQVGRRDRVEHVLFSVLTLVAVGPPHSCAGCRALVLVWTRLTHSCACVRPHAHGFSVSLSVFSVCLCFFGSVCLCTMECVCVHVRSVLSSFVFFSCLVWSHLVVQAGPLALSLPLPYLSPSSLPSSPRPSLSLVSVSVSLQSGTFGRGSKCLPTI